MNQKDLYTAFNNKSRGTNSKLNVHLRQLGLTDKGKKPAKITRLFNHYQNNGNNETTTPLPAKNNPLSREDKQLISGEKLRLEKNHERTKAAGKILLVGSAAHTAAAIVTKAAGKKKRAFTGQTQINWLKRHKCYLEGVAASTIVLMNMTTHLQSFERSTNQRWQPRTAASVAKIHETVEASFDGF